MSLGLNFDLTHSNSRHCSLLDWMVRKSAFTQIRKCCHRVENKLPFHLNSIDCNVRSPVFKGTTSHTLQTFNWETILNHFLCHRLGYAIRLLFTGTANQTGHLIAF